MKQKSAESLGVVVAIDCPGTVDEYNQQSGRVDAALDDALTYHIYHGHLGRFRTAFVKALEEETGEKRLEVGTNSKTNKPILEKDKDYVDRITKGAEPPRDPSEFQPIADKVSQELGPLNLAPVRQSGPGQEYVNGAESLIKKLRSGAGDMEKTIANLEAMNPGVKVEREEDNFPKVASLAIAIRANKARILKAAETELLAV